MATSETQSMAVVDAIFPTLSQDDKEKVIHQIIRGAKVGVCSIGRPVIAKLPQNITTIYAIFQDVRNNNAIISGNLFDTVINPHSMLDCRVIKTFDIFLGELTENEDVVFFNEFCDKLKWNSYVETPGATSLYDIYELKSIIFDGFSQIDFRENHGHIEILHGGTLLSPENVNKNVVKDVFDLMEEYDAPDDIFILIAFVLSPFQGWKPINKATSYIYAGL